MDNLLYNALMLGRNKDVENEEFLVAQGTKKPAAFKVMQNNIEVEEVTSDTFIEVDLEQTMPGYFEMEIYAPDDILVPEKKILTSEDFIEDKFKLIVKIPVERVHNGKNFTRLYFRSSNQEIELPVVINNRIRVSEGGDARKKLLIELEENYLSLRMNKLTSSEWVIKDLKLLENFSGADAGSLFIMLYKAQLYIMNGDMEKAHDIMDFVAEQLPKLTKPDYELSCYYIYVKSLYSMDNYQTELALEKERLVYMRIPSWKILWMIFYMDHRYGDDPERKLQEIEDVCMKGAASPEMYFEALEIFLSRPNLIKGLGNFELQVLNFAVKKNFINSAIVDRTAEIVLGLSDAELKASNIKLAVKILKGFYEQDPSSNILKALCTLLVYTGTRDQADNEYFAKAIREDLNVSGIYNFYVYTVNKIKMEAFPAKLLEHFLENADSLGEYRSYFYANIIINRYKQPDWYRAYVNNILVFAENQLEKGVVDEYMGIICREILSGGLYTRKIQENLFSIICTKKIYCSNPRMISVLVFHRELNLYQDVHIEEGKAFVNIYSQSAIILFKDITGNIYHNVEYEKIDLIDTNEYIDLCIKDVPINRYMLLEDTLPLLRAYKDPVDILQYLSNQLSTGLLRTEYEKRLMRESVMSFSKTRDINVYDELLEFKKFNLDEETMGRLIEIMIDRTLYKKALEEIRVCGHEHVSDEYVAKLAHVVVEFAGNNEADPLILELCERAFKNTPFDQEVFDYLVTHSSEDIELLINMYRAASAYERNTDRIEEKIIRQAVAQKKNPDGTFNVFTKYYEHGNDEKLKDDYLTFLAVSYLHRPEKKDRDFFRFLENGFIQKKIFDDRVYAAYLYYIVSLESPSSSQIKLAEKIVKDLTRRGIMLERFKGLKKYFELPSTLANGVIASKFTDEDGSIPEIEFAFSDDEETKKEEMNRILEGCFAKYFTLFTGEKVRYKIDDEEEVEVKYADLNILPDESRFAELNELIRLCADGGFDALVEDARQYYIKDKLIDRIFNSDK